MYETSPTEVAMWKRLCTHLRLSAKRSTKENSTLAREIEKSKNCLIFAWLEENVSAPVSLERKSEERSMCVGDCIDSDRDRFSAKSAQ